MCLDTVMAMVVTKHTGWKVFTLGIDRSELLGYSFGRYRSKIRPIGKWINEKDFRISDRDTLFSNFGDIEYPLGWHIFDDKRGAEEWMGGSSSGAMTIKKVRYYGVVAVGEQNGYRVIVARYIKIERS